VSDQLLGEGEGQRRTTKQHLLLQAIHTDRQTRLHTGGRPPKHLEAVLPAGDRQWIAISANSKEGRCPTAIHRPCWGFARGVVTFSQSQKN
jgi:hypothetical protein